MSKDSSKSQDLLRDAIREVSGAPATTHRGEVRSGSGASNTDLRNVVGELTGIAGSASRTTDTVSQSNPDALREALQAPWANPAAAGKPSKASSAEIPPQPPAGLILQDAVRDASGFGSANASSSDRLQPRAAQASGRLNDAVGETYSGGPTAPIDEASTSGTSLRRFGLPALVVVLVLGVAAALWFPQRPSGPAGTVQILAQAVEQYRSTRNGSLPPELSALDAFPKGAVEWPLRFWNARDAAGRIEIFWIPQRDGHYRIVLRQGGEVWTVSDRENKPKRIGKGAP